MLSTVNANHISIPYQCYAYSEGVDGILLVESAHCVVMTLTVKALMAF